ncbi:peptidase A4 family-domain-containing protein [Phanerochaete sordida]|uniref:Peptidase A4 family-domain-containing protein n=1 Tax=Phanerochaete sordida TaxID=48140 RepID=A0A9P3GN36_9APHY|nr:peptidase A4 family-domain-containing protein [Phanerochaete sordida]
MLFSSLFSASLLASALALPSSKERFDARVARRAAGTHLSHPRISNGTDVQYSSNWAGGVLSAAGGTWKSVTATFTVPTPKEPAGASGTHAASVWVGIDGDTCGTAILQTGIDLYVSGTSVGFDAWYEWYPDYAYDFSGISFGPGDSVTVTVTASSKTTGTAVVTNNSRHQSVSKALSSSASLCEQDAEWIVEDFSESGGLVPFANFGTVTFTGASATNAAGGHVGPAGANAIDIEQNGQVLTSVQLGASTVTVTYV